MKNGLNTAKKIQSIEFSMPKVMVSIQKKISAKDQWPQLVHFGTLICLDSNPGQVGQFSFHIVTSQRPKPTSLIYVLWHINLMLNLTFLTLFSSSFVSHVFADANSLPCSDSVQSSAAVTLTKHPELSLSIGLSLILIKFIRNHLTGI